MQSLYNSLVSTFERLKQDWSPEYVAKLKASRPSKVELTARFDSVRSTIDSCMAFMSTFREPSMEMRGKAEHVYVIICDTCSIGFEILDCYPPFGMDPEASIHLQDRWSLLHKCMAAEKCLQRGFGQSAGPNMVSSILAEKLANYMCSGPGAGLQAARVRLVDKLTLHGTSGAAEDYNKALYILYSALAKEAKRYQAHMDRNKETVYLYHLGLRGKRTKTYLAEALELEALLDQEACKAAREKGCKKKKRRSLALDLVDDVSKEEDMTCYCHQPFLDCVMEHFQQLIDVPSMNRVLKYKILASGFADARKFHVAGSQQKRADSSCSVTGLLWMAVFFNKSFGTYSVVQDLYNRATTLLADMPASAITSWHKRAAADIKGIAAIRSAGEQAARNPQKYADVLDEIVSKQATLPLGEFMEWIAKEHTPKTVPDMVKDDCEYLKLYKASESSTTSWPETFRIVISALKAFDIYYYVSPKPCPAVISNEKQVLIFQTITKCLLSYFDWMTGRFNPKFVSSPTLMIHHSGGIVSPRGSVQLFNSNGALLKPNEVTAADSKAHQTWKYIDILSPTTGPTIKRFPPMQLQEQNPCAIDNGELSDMKKFASFRRASADQVQFHPLMYLEGSELRAWEKQRDEEWKHWEQQTFLAPPPVPGASGPSWTELDAVDEAWLAQETANWVIAADCEEPKDTTSDEYLLKMDKGKSRAKFVRPLYDEFEKTRRSTHPAPSEKREMPMERLSDMRQTRSKSLEGAGDESSIGELTSSEYTHSVSSRLSTVSSTPTTVSTTTTASNTSTHSHGLFKKRSAIKRSASANPTPTPQIIVTSKDSRGNLKKSNSTTHSKNSSDEDEGRDLILKHILSNGSSNASQHSHADSVPRSESGNSVGNSLKKLSSFKSPSKLGGKLSGFAQKIKRKPSFNVVKS